MLTTRREFLASAALAATPQPAPQFGLHAFIEANPKAVFIRRTNVPHKMDSARKLQEGLKLAREIFVPMQEGGIPVSHKIILKPNITSVRTQRPAVENWGGVAHLPSTRSSRHGTQTCRCRPARERGSHPLHS